MLKCVLENNTALTTHPRMEIDGPPSPDPPTDDETESQMSMEPQAPFRGVRSPLSIATSPGTTTSGPTSPGGPQSTRGRPPPTTPSAQTTPPQQHSQSGPPPTTPQITPPQRAGGSHSNEDGPPSKKRRKLPAGTKRIYTAGEMGRINIGFSEGGICEFSDEIKKARRSDVFNCLPTPQERAKVFTAWLTSFPWNRELESCLEMIQRQDITVDTHGGITEEMVRHLQFILSLPDIIGNISQNYVGRYLRKVEEESETESQRDVMVSLGNIAENLKLQDYKQYRNQCSEANCARCTAAKEWEENAQARNQQQQRPLPCTATQILTLLRERAYTNLHTTYFKQCIALCKEIPPHSPLTYCPESPTFVRLMGVKLPQDISRIIRPAALSGLSPVYKVIGEEPDASVDAIQYLDGDGGMLVAKFLPGLHNYATKQGIIMQDDIVHNSMLIPFREKFHDAIELGHQYRIESQRINEESPTSRKLDFGLQGLVKARLSIAQSKHTFLVPHGADQSGDRLLVELYTHETDDCTIWEETGVKMIKSGLSFPTEGAPPQYIEAAAYAKENKHGIWEYGEVLNDDRLKPWNLKHELLNIGAETEVEVNTEEAYYKVQVKNVADHLNESHLMVGKSVIPGAGRGLFVRPKPLNCTSRIVIPKGRKICYYSATPLSSTDPEPDNRDYLFHHECGRITRRYNPLIYNGKNMGRFVNQAALVKCLELMCSNSDLQSGHTSLSEREINRVAESEVNVAYRTEGVALIIYASKDIVLTDSPIELLGNYGVVTYWVNYIMGNLSHLDPNSTLVKSVLWCLYSRHSNWSQTKRSEFTEGHDISEDIIIKYENMVCPFTRPRTRRQ